MIYTVLDVETTGLSREYDDILSFGYIRIDQDFNVYDSNELYFYKELFNIEKPQAQAIHGLTRDFLKQYEADFSKNLSAMYSLCYNGNIISKNGTKFDIPFIRSFCSRMCPELDTLEFSKSYDIQDIFSGYYQKVTGSTKKGKLGDYLNVLDISTQDVSDEMMKLPRHGAGISKLHGALFDATATLMVLRKYCVMSNQTLGV